MILPITLGDQRPSPWSCGARKHTHYLTLTEQGANCHNVCCSKLEAVTRSDGEIPTRWCPQNSLRVEARTTSKEGMVLISKKVSGWFAQLHPVAK